MNRISLSSHCALISGNLVSLNENSVCWNFHALIHKYHISYQHIILMNFHQVAVSAKGYSLSFICYTV